MKHKLISTQSNNLLSYFNSLGKSGFTIAEAHKALPKSKENAIRELLSDMTKRGLLMRVKEGVYHIIPYEQDPDSFMPDWHLLAEHLVQNTDYYIGYYSALHVHNLIVQPSLKEQIVVARQIKPSILNIKNVVFQFIYHNPKHFFGVKKTWIDSFHKVRCSDLEKTIIDCLFKPHYAGGMLEIARAIYASKNRINFDTLYNYVEKFDSQAVTKRLGYLLETLEMKSPIIEKLQRIKSGTYIVLDTELPKTGRYISRWGIQENVDRETIKSALHT